MKIIRSRSTQHVFRFLDDLKWGAPDDSRGRKRQDYDGDKKDKKAFWAWSSSWKEIIENDFQ